MASLVWPCSSSQTDRQSQAKLASRESGTGGARLLRRKVAGLPNVLLFFVNKERVPEMLSIRNGSEEACGDRRIDMRKCGDADMR